MTVNNSNPLRAILLYFESSIMRMILEVLQLEGYEVHAVRTAREALSLLAYGREQLGTTVVIIDNLQVHDEGQAFLEDMRNKPTLHNHVIFICSAINANCDAARQKYGDVLDRYLVMPFTVWDLLAVLDD